MASLIPGFEYDIFISYRQKDNKGDKWVSEFVDALATELESTFKEEVSIYFDINPHDGLLETYDVGASLYKKLKCLVFIPIVSRTYCDPKSFAWDKEFKAFVEQAASDKFGLRVTLSNGNVMNRVLPIRIHDLDVSDIKLCESLLGGVMRGVDFVYKSSGVNRPLRHVEDHPHDNTNKTYYRDQINKVANSIKDIIQSLIEKDNQPEAAEISDQPRRNIPEIRPAKMYLKKYMLLALLSLVILTGTIGSYFFFRSVHISNTAKTIAVIPLTNPPNDPELRKYAVGSMDAIIAKLQNLKAMTVRGKISCGQYIDTKKTMSELRKELKANYLVAISVSKLSDKLSMWVGLTTTQNDKQIWAKEYDLDENKLMPMFSQVVRNLANNMNISFTTEETMNIEKDLSKNPEAYLNYLKASAELIEAMGNKYTDSINFKSVIRYYDKAIALDSGFAIAYARRAIAISWGVHSGELAESELEKCKSDIAIASRIDKDLPDIDIARGFYNYYGTREFGDALINFESASVKDPQDYQPLLYIAAVHRVNGNWARVSSLLDKVIRFNIQSPLDLTNIGMSFDYMHKYDSALMYHQKAIDINPDWPAAYQNKIYTLLLKNGNTSEAHSVLDTLVRKFPVNQEELRILMDMYDQKYIDAFIRTKKAGNKNFAYSGQRLMYLGKLSELMNKDDSRIYYDSALIEIKKFIKTSPDSAKLHSMCGIIYASLGNREDAIKEAGRSAEIVKIQKNSLQEIDIIQDKAEMYTKLGMFKEAVENIELVLNSPSYFSAKMMQMDPVWKPLLKDPQMKKIITRHNRN